MTSFISQIIANGSQVEFNFDFKISTDNTVNTYSTPPGETSSEVNDIVSDSQYSLIFNNPSSDISAGKIIFNVAPENGYVITITPKSDADINIDFTKEGQLNPENLNKGFDRHTSPIDYTLFLFDNNVLRYNINIDQSQAQQYSLLLPLLNDGDFWRRLGANIVSQGYDEFVSEVTNDVDINITAFVNDAKLWSSSPIGNQFTTSTGETGYSSLNWSHWSFEWATSTDVITDTAGNTGRSARYWANEAQEAISAAGGLIEEIYITNSTATEIPLVNGSPVTAWLNVTEKAVSVYKNGLRLPQTGEYTFDIKTNPTVADPSKLILNTPLIVTDTLSVDRSEPQGQGGTMLANSTNAIFESGSLVASKALNNVTFNGTELVAKKDLSNIASVNKVNAAISLGDQNNVANTLVSRDVAGKINADVKINSASEGAQPFVTLADSDKKLIAQTFDAFKESLFKITLGNAGELEIGPLLIQWGQSAVNESGVTINFQTDFSGIPYYVGASSRNFLNSLIDINVYDITTSNFKVKGNNGLEISFLSIGAK